MMKKLLSKIQKRFKKENILPDKTETTCGNCQTIFAGNYCPECGQSKKEFDRPFSFVFYDFMGNFIAFDYRFYKTFVYLISKPGFLTKEFFEGRRVRYSPPFRTFIFLSFILFLFIQYYSNQGLSKVLSTDVGDGTVQLNDINSQIAVDSLIKVLPAELDSALNEKGVDVGYKYDFAMLRDSSNLQSALLQLSEELEKKLKNSTDPKEKRRYQTYIQLCRSPELALSRILKYISWAFFLLLPIFALVLKLFYIRRKQNYVRHLIFSIHLHSFWFLVLIFIFLFYYLFPTVNESIAFMLILGCGAYFFIALKKVYQQRFSKTLFKFIGISFVYYFVFISVVMLAMINALSIV